MSINGRELEGVARIKVIGIGGGGSNAVNRMYREELDGIEYNYFPIDKICYLAFDLLNSINPIPNNITAPPTNTCFVGSSPSKKIEVDNPVRGNKSITGITL